MEDINVIKEKIYELKQYSNKLMQDLTQKLEAERDSKASDMKSALEQKDYEIKEVNEKMELVKSDNEKLTVENVKLKKTIASINSFLDSAVKICEEVD